MEWVTVNEGERCTIVFNREPPRPTCGQRAAVYSNKEKEWYCPQHLINELKQRMLYKIEDVLEDFDG